ncbi:MAG: selenide, water dikinase SelD [Fimbriiglobus sp.]
MAETTKTRLTDYASCAGCAAKLPPTGIADVLKHLPKHRDPRMLVGTETHDDAGVFELTPELALVQTVDFFPPIVDDPYLYGQIAATNAISDVYAMGGTPITALNIVTYPDDQLSGDWLGAIMAGGAEICTQANVSILGGHTVRDAEIKFGLAVTGTIHPKRILTNAGAKPGDVLILTKPLGTGFVTTAAKKATCPEALYRAACDSMKTLNRAACEAALEVGVNAITDVTGFGLAGHGYEMASGSQVTIRFWLNRLPTFSGLQELDLLKFRTRASKTNRQYTADLTHYDMPTDDLRLELIYDAQTSGGLLLSVPEARAEALQTALENRGCLASAIIGEVLPLGAKSLIASS